MSPRLDPKKRIGQDVSRSIKEVGLSIDDNLKAMEDMGSAEFLVRDIAIDRIVPSKKNFFEVTDIKDLAEDIRENGLSHNLLVRPIEDERFEIISGERRYEALKILGWTKAPCKVEEGLTGNDIDTEIKLINTNAKTRQLTDLEKAKAVERLNILYSEKKSKGIKIKGRIRDNIASDMGISGIKVERLNKLNRLIPGLKESLKKNRISTSAVEQFSGMDVNSQKVILSLIESGDIVSLDMAKDLKDKWEKKKEKLKTEVRILENERELKQKKLEEIRNENASDNENIKVSQSDIEENAEITIAARTLCNLISKNDLKISDKNLIELKKLKDELEVLLGKSL